MATAASGRGDATRARRADVRTWDETKPSWMTTELYVLIAAVVGTIAAGESSSSWDARWVWQVVAALAIGYMISRGLAKAGSPDNRTFDRD